MLGEPVLCVTQPTSLSQLYDPRSVLINLTQEFSYIDKGLLQVECMAMTIGCQ